MKRYRFVIGGVLLLLLVLFFSWNAEGVIKEKIKEGEIQYSKELGFINWDHANPEGTISAFKRLQSVNCVDTDSIEFTYTQKMVITVGTLSAVAEYTETRKLPTHLTSEEEQIVFLEIFTSVTASFEKMQGELPYAIIPQTRASSFRKGDLMGNLLSFYMAISSTTVATLRDDLTMVSSAEALEIFETMKVSNHKKADWNALMTPLDDSIKIVKTLKKIIEVSQKLETPQSIKTTSSKRFYFL